MPTPHRAIILSCIGALMLSACGGDDALPPLPPVQPANEIRLLPASGTVIGVGQSQFTYVEHDSIPSSTRIRLDSRDLQWSSSNPSIASVDDAGIISAHAPGEVVITARFGELTDSATLRVAGTVTTHAVTVPGQGLRRYVLWSPEVTAAVARPLVLAMHGGGGTPSIHASMTLLNTLAAGEGYHVAYLEGTGFFPTFNAGGCCGHAQANEVDDVAYAAAVLDDVARRVYLDEDRIYATGFSNGAMMSHRLICELPGRFAAIAAVSGTPVRHDPSGDEYYSCDGRPPVPVLHVHATNDRTVPIGGGPSNRLEGLVFPPLQEALAEVIDRNNVTHEAVTTRLTEATTCHRHEMPADPALPSAPVEICIHDPVDDYDPALGVAWGGGHSWPGGLPSPAASADIPARDFVVNDRIRDFFSEARR